jgi:hypothetical protein
MRQADLVVAEKEESVFHLGTPVTVSLLFALDFQAIGVTDLPASPAI